MMLDFHTWNSKIDSENIIKLFESIISTSQDGLYVCDQYGKTLIVNDALLEITNITAETFYSYQLHELIQKGILPKSCAYETLKSKKKENMIIDYYHGKKAVLTSTPVFDNNGEIFCVVSNVRDITELNNLHKKLEESNRLKMEYEDLLFKNNELFKNFNSKLIYKSEAMKEVVLLAEKLSKTDSPILLLGESGSGKDILAQYIHEKSNRNGEFVKVNCAAIPADLIESELFGYEKGAFTGANVEKPGLFELSNGGTIFLDEIGDMPLKLQVKLLNVIEEKLVRRIGGSKSFPIDMRIIAATNVDLAAMVENQKFRRDLYYRLNVLPISLPPLRNRKIDIPILTIYFLNKLNKKYNHNKRIDPLIIEKFLSYNWPGNVRELNNIVERMFHMNESEKISVDSIPQSIKNEIKLNYLELSFNSTILNQSNNVQKNSLALDNILPLNKAISLFEKEYISNVIKQNSTLKESAESLKISLSTLMRKRKKYNLKKS